MADDVTPPDQVSRRQALTGGAGAIISAFAGCADELATQEFSAATYGAGRKGMAPFGFGQGTHETVERSRSVSLSEFEGELVMKTQLVSYGQDARVPETNDWAASPQGTWSAGVIATPEAKVGDEPLNPYASESLDELVTGERSAELLSATGFGSEDTGWVSGPVSIASRSGTMLERETEIGAWLGVVPTDSGPTPVAVYASLVRVDGDAVLAALVDRRSLPAGVSPAEYVDLLEEYVGAVGLAALGERLLWSDWFMRVIEKISPPIVVDVDLNAVDVVFVLDTTVGGALPTSDGGSDSQVSESEAIWALRVGAIRSIVERLSGAAKAGLVTYDAFVDVRQELTLDESTVTDDLGSYYQEGGDPSEALVTGLRGGLNELKGSSRGSSNGNPRDYAKKVMIVVSDGSAAPRFDTKPEMLADEIKSLPAELYCISFSENADSEKLATVASDPSEQYYLQGPSDHEIASTFDEIASAP